MGYWELALHNNRSCVDRFANLDKCNWTLGRNTHLEEFLGLCGRKEEYCNCCFENMRQLEMILHGCSFQAKEMYQHALSVPWCRRFHEYSAGHIETTITSAD